jgi:hypothetical protein
MILIFESLFPEGGAKNTFRSILGGLPVGLNVSGRGTISSTIIQVSYELVLLLNPDNL